MSGMPRLLRRLRRRPHSELVIVATIAAILGIISVCLVPGPLGALGALLGFCAVLIAEIDARYFIIPDELSLCALIAGLIQAAVAHDGGRSLLLPVARGAAFALTLLGVRVFYRHFRGREGLGLGDVKLGFIAGVWLEIAIMPLALELATLSAIAAYLTGQFGNPINKAQQARLPFGLFFAPSIWLGWLLQETMLKGTTSLF